MRTRSSTHVSRALVLAVALSVAGAVLTAQPQDAPATTFRTSRDIVSIDVVVRDRSGAVVRGLTTEDFEIREDGRPETILTSSYQEIDTSAAPLDAVPLLTNLGAPGRASAPPDAIETVHGRRIVLMLFDLSSMEPEEVDRGVDAALDYVNDRMSNADLVSVATLTWELRVLTDFTGDREAIRQVLRSLAAVSLDVRDAAGADPADNTGDVGTSAPLVAATDARLRALRLLAEALAPITQKKTLLYFTGGLANAAQDTPSELRAATTAAARANLAIYPVDARGLQAVIPSGPARVASRNGEGLFSGRDVNDQFSELAASQDTMASMATATGGRLLSGINDLSGAFTLVQRDTAAYYILGYSSSNTARDGRFRRVQVRVRRDGLRVEARQGYYADRDFAHTSRQDRELQLEDGLVAAPALSTLSVTATANWVGDTPQARVPVELRISGLRLVENSRRELDVLATFEDEQGRQVARLRETVTLVASAASEPVVYHTEVRLPPGRYTMTAAVRENQRGTIGRIDTAIDVPEAGSRTLEIAEATVVAQSVAVSESASASAHAVNDVNVLVRDTLGDAGSPLIVSAALFRENERILDLVLSERARRPVSVAGGNAGVVVGYSGAANLGSLAPGRYTTQITVVDPATRRVAVSRNTVVVP